MVPLRGSIVAMVAVASIALLGVASVYAQGTSAAGAAEPSQVSLHWKEIVGLIVSTGVVSALLTNLLGFWRDRRKERVEVARAGGYLALRVAVILEKFVIDCAELLEEVDLFNQTRGQAGKTHGELPLLTAYPSDVEWKTLDPKLLSRTLSFRNELSLSGMLFKFTYEMSPEDITPTCVEQAGKFGCRAWEIATDLRSHYSFPEIDTMQVAVSLKKERVRAVAEAAREY